MLSKFLTFFLSFSLLITTTSFAAKPTPSNQASPRKQKLVLIPIVLSDHELKLRGQIETALVSGLQERYVVFSGDNVLQKQREVFAKESKEAKGLCDETKCMQDLAEGFGSELVAVVHVTKEEGNFFTSGRYILSINVQNIFDNKAVYNNVITSKNTDTVELLDKLKELGRGETVAPKTPEVITPPVKEEKPIQPAKADAENELWSESQKGNSVEDYAAYLDTYPKGKYASLAKARVKKFKAEQTPKPESVAPTPPKVENTADNESLLWTEAQKGNTADDFNAYLETYPKGKYAALAKTRIKKINETAEAETRNMEQQSWATAQEENTQDSYRRYLDNYPKGKFVPLAKARMGKVQVQETTIVPPRPDLPFDVSEDIWKTIETSKAYLNLPRPRTIKVNSKTKIQMQYTGSKSSSLPAPAATTGNANKDVQPLGNKCTVSTGSNMENYVCGFIPLGSKIGGKLAGKVKNLDITGSLFPMRIGAEVAIHSESSYIPDSKYDSASTTKCRVVGKGSASNLSSQLRGTAWEVSCSNNMEMNNKPINSTSTNYFLEDLGVFLSDIGQISRDGGDDSAPHYKFILPTPGSGTVIVAGGEYGSRMTTTYETYDWSVGK